MALTERISAACGRKKAELVLKHAKIVNVFTETIEEGDVAVEDGVIVGIGAYEGVREIDVKGKYVAPGLIDGHIHLESSMASPEEFARMVVPHGTAAVVTDPHEIANVAGNRWNPLYAGGDRRVRPGCVFYDAVLCAFYGA